MNNALMIYFYDKLTDIIQARNEKTNVKTCKNKINKNVNQQIVNKGVDKKICKYFENYKLQDWKKNASWSNGQIIL